MSDTDLIRAAFAQDHSLQERVLSFAQRHVKELQLVLDIARYITRTSSTASSQPTTNGTTSHDDNGSKKRKLDAPDGLPVSKTVKVEDAVTLLAMPDTSFAVPVRKKLNVELLGSKSGQKGVGGVIAYAGTERGNPVVSIRWEDVDQVFCLPVPEKAQRAQNFVVLLNSIRTNAQEGTGTDDQFVWTLPETVPKNPGPEFEDGDTPASVMRRALNIKLAELGKKVIEPDSNEFASAIPQSHRKGEKAYHVKAHVGSKEGYLFFLPTGILHAFRKPLTFHAFDSITSISYTSVLQRTFNLVISSLPPQTEPESDPTDTEYAMIDQADFAGIDAYIKTHGLNDASMAAERRARKYNVNNPRKAGGEGADGRDLPTTADGERGTGGSGDEEMGELQKAEAQLQDQEDEDEEDYDPSGGESEGEGEDSDEEGENNGEDGDVEGEEYDEGDGEDE